MHRPPYDERCGGVFSLPSICNRVILFTQDRGSVLGDEMRHLRDIADPHRQRLVDPGQLRELGQRAAQMLTESGDPLDDAVVRVVRSYGKPLNNLHIQRIVEIANLRSFQALRDRRLHDGGKPVSFSGGPASALRVLALLGRESQGSKEAEMTSTQDRLMGQVSAMVGAGLEKAASVPDVDYVDLLQKLEGAEGRCRYSAALLGERKVASLRKLCDQSRAALADGANPAQVRFVLEASAGPEHGDFLEQAWSAVKTAASLRVEEHDLEKAAASLGRVNPEHPLFKAASEFYHLGLEHEIAEMSLDKLREQRVDLLRALRHAS